MSICCTLRTYYTAALTAGIVSLLPSNGTAAASSLLLAGTVVGTGIRSAAVILDEGARQQYLIYEGNKLGNAVIKKVEAKRIILTEDDRETILVLNGRINGIDLKQSPALNEPSPQMLPPDLIPPPPPPAPAPMEEPH